MQIKNKKRVLIWTVIASILLAALALTAVLVVSFISKNPMFNKYSSMMKQFKDIDEKNLAEYNPASQRAIDVMHYTIKVDLYPKVQKIIGDATIQMRINNPKLKSIDLNFYDNLEIKKVELNGAKAEYQREEKILHVQKPTTIIDSAEVRIIYSGTPQSLGFGSFSFGNDNGSPYVYSLSEPIYASTWFPCIDLPDDKALADIFITNDSSAVSVSNGKLVEVKTFKNKRTYHWKTFYPISTYLIALYSANYKSFSEKYVSVTHDTLNLNYFVLPDKLSDAKRDFADHKDYIKTFEGLFGPYPFIKEKYSVAEFWWDMGAMENQTVTGIGSNFITGHKLFRDMLIHELSHHWWGDAVGPKTWKDIWLNEGFATYSEALYWEKQSDSSALHSTMQPKFGTFEKGTLYNPGKELFSKLVYDKGAWVLHMLRKEVGNKVFFQIIKTYFEMYKYSNASTFDFKKLCETISKKDLSYFFNQWVFKGEGIIELGCDWNTVQSGTQFLTTIKIKQLQNGYDIYKFPLDIKLNFGSDNNFSVSSSYVSNKVQEIKLYSQKKPVRVILDPNKWLLAKINVAGSVQSN
jgi:aminopeptidase N